MDSPQAASPESPDPQDGPLGLRHRRQRRPYFTISSVPETGCHSLSLDAKPYSFRVSKFIATVSVYPDSGAR